MANENVFQMPKFDVSSTNEMVLEAMAAFAKQREEANKINREALEKMNVLVKAASSTALDLYDFNVKLTESWFAIVETTVKNAAAATSKAVAKAA